MATPTQNSPPTAGSRVPLHLQISEMLMREIQAGVLADGERLPPEREMAENLQISVGTLRKALADLETRGMLLRVQGSGNYIHYTLDVDNVYALFRLELARGGGKPSAQLLSVSRLKKPADLPDFGSSDDAIRFRRLRRLDAVDAALEEIWLDGSYASAVRKVDIGDSLYLYYKEQLGFWITRAEDRVWVAPQPAWTPEHMRAKKGARWGFIERLSRDHRGKTAEFSRTWFDPDSVRFVAR